ncbi:MAG: hypothetical protein ACLFUJ_02395 [Phycisphaerae bacterium]
MKHHTLAFLRLSAILLVGCNHGLRAEKPAETGPRSVPTIYRIRLPELANFAGPGQQQLQLTVHHPQLPWQRGLLSGQAIHRGNSPMHVDASALRFGPDGEISGKLAFRLRWRDVTVGIRGRRDGDRLAGTARYTIKNRRGTVDRQAQFDGSARKAGWTELAGIGGSDPNWPDWPGQLNWQRVVDITTVEGADWDEKIQAAQKKLADTGGVIWLPPGRYELRKTIRLQSGIILRGANPTGPGDPRDPRYALPSQLVFPQYQPSFTGDGTDRDSAFAGIELAEADSGSNVGVVNLDIHFGHIHLGRWDGFPQRFADGSAGRGFLVCGNILRHAATLDEKIPTEWQHPWQRWTDRYAAAIHCYARADVLIAGNRIPQSGQANFLQEDFRLYSDKPATHEQPKTKEITTIDVPFDYDNRPGIMVNPKPLAKGLQIWDDVQKVTDPPSADSGTDIPPAWGLAEGIIIRGNYIFNTGCVAIKTSGDGTFVGFNVIRYKPGVVRPTYTGLTLSNFTNDCRAIEMKGWRWTVQGNDYEVYSNYGPDGTKYNDGEGIMHEAWENVGVRDSRIIGNRGNAYICLWRTPVRGLEIRDNHIRTAGGQPAITVLGQTNRDVDLPAERVRIVDNVTEGSGIKLIGRPGDQSNVIRGNRHAGPGGDIRDETGAEQADNVGYR